MLKTSELILKPSIFGYNHRVVSIVRDNSETVNLFPFAVIGEVSHSKWSFGFISSCKF